MDMISPPVRLLPLSLSLSLSLSYLDQEGPGPPVTLQGLQPAKVLPSYAISPGRQGNGAATEKREKRSGSIILQ
jgi:hypothetical protein